MWHSIYSTGIPDIDNQHRTIDHLITMYSDASSRDEEERCLLALSKAVHSHFQFIEYFFEVRFPDEFKQRQDRMLARLSEKIQQSANGELTREELARDLRRMFLSHANSQCSKLKSLD